MKVIALIPVKNEDWILEASLKNLSPYVDHIIIADQDSTDKTVEIAKSFPNVVVINNPNEGHSNKVRWLLLDEARKLGDNNLIICPDADEMVSPKAIEQMKSMVNKNEARPGDVFRFRWVQFWKDINHYRNDGVWKDSFKNIAFIDNPGINEYKRDFVINDHTSRVPDTNIHKEINIEYPLLHFHFLARKRNQLKQAWYRCKELIDGKRNAKRINNTYRITLEPKNIEAYEIEPKWIEGLTLPQNLDSTTSSWHLQSLIEAFDKHGIEFFEDLQIWHVSELRDEFIKRVGRAPISKTYPTWLSWINELKNIIRNGLTRLRS